MYITGRSKVFEEHEIRQKAQQSRSEKAEESSYGHCIIYIMLSMIFCSCSMLIIWLHTLFSPAYFCMVRISWNILNCKAANLVCRVPVCCELIVKMNFFHKDRKKSANIRMLEETLAAQIAELKGNAQVKDKRAAATSGK